MGRRAVRLPRRPTQTAARKALRCPDCGAGNTAVISTRAAGVTTNGIRRRRACARCRSRFTTVELIVGHDLSVYTAQRARAAGIAGQLREMAAALEVW